MAESIQQTLGQAGIKLEIIPGDGKQTLTKYRARNHDIYIGNACVLIKQLPRYDLIFMGDVIEHLDKAAGFQLLRDAVKKAGPIIKIIANSRCRPDETTKHFFCNRSISVWAARCAMSTW